MTKLTDKLNDIIFELEERYYISKDIMILEKLALILEILSILLECDKIDFSEVDQIRNRIQDLKNQIEENNK